MVVIEHPSGNDLKLLISSFWISRLALDPILSET